MAQARVDRLLADTTPAFLGSGSTLLTEQIPNADIPQQRRLVPVALSENFGNLRAFCRNNNVQLHTVFEAAWALVLGRYLGAEQIVFTSIVENGSVRAQSVFQSVVDETVSILQLLRDIESGSRNSQETVKAGQPLNSEERPLLNSCIRFQTVQHDVSAVTITGQFEFTVSSNNILQIRRCPH
jgi:hypothetical protein